MVEYSTSGSNASILRINKIDGDTVVEQREVEAIKAYYADDLMRALQLAEFHMHNINNAMGKADYSVIQYVLKKAKGE